MKPDLHLPPPAELPSPARLRRSALIAISVAVVLLFVTGHYWEVLRGLTASYAAMPAARLFNAEIALSRIAGVLSDAFLLALRISSPFIIYAVVVNFAIGLANKLTPQIPVYFISLPFVLGGGLFLLYFTAPEMLNLFIDGFADWLSRG